MVDAPSVVGKLESSRLPPSFSGTSRCALPIGAGEKAQPEGRFGKPGVSQRLSGEICIDIAALIDFFMVASSSPLHVSSIRALIDTANDVQWHAMSPV